MADIGPRAKQPHRDVWRVGVLFSRSGLMAVTESEHFFGTALAIEEINRAGGVLGREIEVIAYDPGSVPETYRKLADRLLTEDGASVIFGCGSFPLAAVAQELAATLAMLRVASVHQLTAELPG